MSDKTYYSKLAEAKNIKRGKTSEDIDRQQSDFMRERAALQSAPVDMPGAGALDEDILRTKKLGTSSEPDIMRVISPEQRQMKVDAAQAASKALREAKMGAPEVEDVLDYGKLRKQMMKMGKGAAKGLKSIPIIGSLAGLASAMQSGDASAAVPILDSAEETGPARGSDEAILEDPSASPKERMMAMQRLRAIQELANRGRE